MLQTQLIDINLLEPNEGQIPGLPRNPRLIKDEKFKKLVASLREDPEMLELRPLLVFAHDGALVVIGGNQRLGGLKELGKKKVPCNVIPPETPIEKLKAYIIKDNIGYGHDDWDVLSTEWAAAQLEDWGMDLPSWVKAKDADEEPEEKTEAGQWFLNIRCGSEKECQQLYEKFVADGLDVKIVA